MTKRIGVFTAKLVGAILFVAVVAEGQNRGLGGSILRLSSTAADALCVGSLAASPAASSCTGGAYLGPTTVTGVLKTGSSPITLTNATGNILSAALATTGVSATTYGSASLVPVLTINAQGQITAASTTAVLPPGQMTLLSGCDFSGTNAAAGATNLADCTISGLTAEDHIRAEVSMSSLTQQTAAISLYNSTDSVIVVPVNAGAAVAAGSYTRDAFSIGPDQASNMTIVSVGTTTVSNGSPGAGVNLPYGYLQTFTTAWTGTWHLVLRHTGVTAGGTFRYRAKFYKVAGQ